MDTLLLLYTAFPMKYLSTFLLSTPFPLYVILRSFSIPPSLISPLSSTPLYKGNKSRINYLISVSLYQMRCAIWYYLYNLKNVKSTHLGVLHLVK